MIEHRNKLFCEKLVEAGGAEVTQMILYFSGSASGRKGRIH